MEPVKRTLHPVRPDSRDPGGAGTSSAYISPLSYCFRGPAGLVIGYIRHWCGAFSEAKAVGTASRFVSLPRRARGSSGCSIGHRAEWPDAAWSG